MIVFSLPWKERTIPYPPRKTNMLLVFVRVGSNPVWLYKGKEQCRWLRGDFRFASLEGRQGGGIDCLLLGAQEGSWGPCRCPGNQVTGSKSTHFLRGAVQAWLRRAPWMTSKGEFPLLKL